MTQRFVAVAVLSLGMMAGQPGRGPTVVGAQQQVVLASRPRFLRVVPPATVPVPVDIRSSNLLRRVVSLDFERATVGDILAAIERQAGVKFIYSRNRIAVDRPVQVRARQITVAGALTEILIGTGIDVLLKGEYLALMERPPVAIEAGAIVGRVIDGKAGQPVAGAEVFLENTRWRTATDSIGRYRLAEIDTGTYTLTVRRLGYLKQSRHVTVGAEREDTINLTVEPAVTRLNDVVTTVTGRRRRVELGNDITTINADSVVRMEPVKSLTDILETRVPGLTVQHTSGAPGDPSRLRLRGAASPLRSNDPIVVVDGIRVYAEQSAKRSGNLATLDITGTPVYAAPSPLDNIDPNTIEKIEVIKGPSAATLYGQDAANGVIVITTKKGKAGPPRWTASAEHGTTRRAGDYPDLMLRWGHLQYNNSTPLYCPASNQIGVPGGVDTYYCAGDSTVTFQLLNDPALTVLDKGQSTRATLGVSGGTAALTYAVTGSYTDETGLPKLPAYEADRYQARTEHAPPDWMRRPQHLTDWSVTNNLAARLGAHADVSLSTSVTRQVQQRSSLEGELGTLMGTYLDRATGTYYRQGSVFDVPFTIIPVSGTGALDHYFTRVTDDALTLTNGLNASWRPRTWLTLTADAGLNWVQRSDQLYLPREAVPGVPPGQVNYGHGSSLLSTANLRANLRAPLGYGFQFQFAAGANYNGKSINDLGVETVGLPEGTSLLGSEINRATPNKLTDATFGWYVEPSFNNSRLFLNLGLRLDNSSSYGGGVTVPKFPKLGFSYLISDESFYPFKNLIPTLRLRTSYGRASRQPGVTDRLRLYGTSQSVWVDETFVTGVFLEHIGNADLRPERTTELEGGFDADFLDNRLSVTFSGYRKTTDDALLGVPLPPSVYGDGVTQLRNIGVVRNTGLELSVEGQLIRSAPLTWSVGVGLSQNRNIVVRLGPGVEPFFTQGGDDGGGIRVAPGYPLFGRWVKPILGYADGNGNGVIDQSEIQLGDTAVYAGSTLPNYTADVHTNVSLWRGAVTMSATLHHDNGLSQKNDVAKSLAVFSPGWNDPTVSPAEQVATSTVSDYNWTQTVNTTRLSSVSVSYRVPAMLARRVGAQMLSVAVQGTNLGLWTNYRGLDPNVNAFSTGNGVLDTGVLPVPRLWQVRVNATY